MAINDRLAKLTRRAKTLAERRPSAKARFVIDADDLKLVKEKLKRENIALNVLCEAVLRGYVNNHPAVLAMLDDWMRARQDHMVGGKPKLFKRKSELEDIYSEIEGDDV